MLSLLLAQGTAGSNPGARFEIVNGALPTSGTTDLTVSGFGTPTDVVLFVTYATIDATITDHAVLAIGASDGTVAGSVGYSVQDAAATTSVANRTIYSAISSAPNPTLITTLDWEINAALITDGVQLSITSAPGSAFLCTALLIGGDDLTQAEVILLDDLGATTGDLPVTLGQTWSAAPSGIIGFTQNGNIAADSVAANAPLSIGVSDFTNHGSVSMGSLDNATGEFTTAMVSDSFMLTQTFNGSVTWNGYPHTPTTTNFQWNRDASPGNDLAVFVVFGVGSGYEVSVDTVTIPSASDVTINTGLTPSFNMVLSLEGPTVYDTLVSTSDVAMGISMYDGTTISALSASITDNTDNLAKSQHSDSLALLNGGGTAASVVGIPSFSGSDVVWTTSTRPAADILGVSLSVGASIAAPVLSSPLDVQTGSDTGQGTVTTDTGNGTLYGVVTQSGTSPSVAQVQAGQDHTGSAADWNGSQAVSGTGAQVMNAGGLTPSTTHYFHFQHQNSGTQDSTVSSADGFTTPAAGGGSGLQLISDPVSNVISSVISSPVN